LETIIASAADLQRPLCIFRVQDAFQDQLAAPAILDPLDVVPTELRIKLLGNPQRDRAHVVGPRRMSHDIAEGPSAGPKHAEAPSRFRRDVENIGKRELWGSGEAVLDVAMALSDDLEIKGKNQRRTPRRLCTVDQTPDEVAILHNVELKPEWLFCVGGNILDRADAHGRKRVWNSRFRRSARDENLTVTALHSNNAGWSQRDRHVDRLPHHRSGKRAIRHINSYALSKLDPREVRLVCLVGAASPRARIDIVVEHPRDALFRQDPQLLDGGDRLRHRQYPINGA
jgi:hypothetical protein